MLFESAQLVKFDLALIKGKLDWVLSVARYKKRECKRVFLFIYCKISFRVHVNVLRNLMSLELFLNSDRHLSLIGLLRLV